jgi:hypothetical protein
MGNDTIAVPIVAIDSLVLASEELLGCIFSWPQDFLLSLCMHESSPTLQQTFTHTQTNIQPESTDAETTFVSTSVGTKTSGRPRKKKFNYRHTHDS